MNYLKHLPLALLTLFCLKYLVLSPSYADIMVLAVLGVTASFFEFHLFNKEFVKLKSDFEKHLGEYKSTQNELVGLQNSFNSNINNIKLNQTLRGKIG